MEYRRVGDSDLLVSEIGFGTWLNVERTDMRKTDLLIRSAIDNGINLFDTADSYGDSQQALGESLKGVTRDSFVISSKVYFLPNGEKGGLSREHITASTDTSLARLGTDYIDLLLAHRFDDSVPLTETLATFRDLISAGKIRYYGFSEWTAQQIENACEIAYRIGAPPPVANQPQYSVLWRTPEKRVLPACERNGLGALAFFPLAQGVLTGKYRPGTTPTLATRAGTDLGKVTMGHLMKDLLLERVEGFELIARHHGLSAAQLALAWVLDGKGVASALVGASSPQQLAENAGASGAVLDERTRLMVDKVFASCVNHGDEATE